MYYGEVLMWIAVENVEESMNSFFDALRTVATQTESDIQSVKDSIGVIEQLDVSEIELLNSGLTDDLLDNI